MADGTRAGCPGIHSRESAGPGHRMAGWSDPGRGVVACSATISRAVRIDSRYYQDPLVTFSNEATRPGKLIAAIQIRTVITCLLMFSRFNLLQSLNSIG